MPRGGLEIAPQDPLTDDVVALLTVHLTAANAASPSEHVHALDLDGLRHPSVTFVTARCDGSLLGVGAIKHLDDRHGELKSMHVAQAARRHGVGRAVLDHLVALAVARGYERVSLETGTMEAFAAARALYRDAGFVPCPPFGPYTRNPYSLCMTRHLG